MAARQVDAKLNVLGKLPVELGQKQDIWNDMTEKIDLRKLGFQEKPTPSAELASLTGTSTPKLNPFVTSS